MYVNSALISNGSEIIVIFLHIFRISCVEYLKIHDVSYLFKQLLKGFKSELKIWLFVRKCLNEPLGHGITTSFDLSFSFHTL